jgi:hypothetical protein
VAALDFHISIGLVVDDAREVGRFVFWVGFLKFFQRCISGEWDDLADVSNNVST